jgi:hypothetical protein
LKPLSDVGQTGFPKPLQWRPVPLPPSIQTLVFHIASHVFHMSFTCLSHVSHIASHVAHGIAWSTAATRCAWNTTAMHAGVLYWPLVFQDVILLYVVGDSFLGMTHKKQCQRPPRKEP